MSCVLPASPERKPNLLVIAGPNGSGKTTFASLLSRHKWGVDALNINADALANELGDWNDEQCTRAAQSMVREQLESALTARRNIMYETVFSHVSKLELIRRALSLGYFVRFFFICTETPRINLDRVAERFAKGGHSVPGDKVAARYSRAMILGAEAMRLVQRGYLYDNSATATPDGRSFRLVLRTIEGRDYKLYSAPAELPPPYVYFLRDFTGMDD